MTHPLLLLIRIPYQNLVAVNAALFSPGMLVIEDFLWMNRMVRTLTEQGSAFAAARRLHPED